MSLLHLQALFIICMQRSLKENGLLTGKRKKKIGDEGLRKACVFTHSPDGVCVREYGLNLYLGWNE